jgi:phage tail sheath gpL-like
VNRQAAVPLVTAATFLVGFGVAELTGVRAIGGLVLLAGGTWCGRAALSIVGTRVTVALLAIALALFVVSHPLGEAIGAWPAVTVSAALAAGAATVLLSRRRGTVGGRIEPPS